MRRILLALTALVLALTAIEASLRMGGVVEYRPLPPAEGEEIRGKDRLLHQASSTDGLAYELVPNQSKRWRRWTIETNSAGMRDDEPLPKAPGLVRIATVGDSFTFGWGVSVDQAYPSVLEELLNEDAAPGAVYDVLNFGVSGYSTRDEAVVLDNKVRRFEPDLIVLGFVLNDIETEPVQPLPNAFAPASWWQYSHLLRLVAQARLEWGVRRRGGGDYFDYLYSDTDRWESLDASFGEIERSAAEMGVRVLLTLFPRIPPPRGSWEGYRYVDIHERVGDLARRHGFLVQDLYPRFSKVAPRRFGVTEQDRHPNGLGHYLAARAIEYRLQHELEDEVQRQAAL